MVVPFRGTEVIASQEGLGGVLAVCVCVRGVILKEEDRWGTLV